MPIKNKYKKLVLCLLYDGIGFISFFIPVIGELIDVVWAPISAYLMTKLYKGEKGKIAAVISFIEEIIPGTDIIPTFTLMWLYTFYFKKK